MTAKLAPAAATNMLRIACRLAGAILLAVVLGAGAPRAQGASPDKLVISYVPGNAIYWDIDVAIEKGFFKDEGAAPEPSRACQTAHNPGEDLSCRSFVARPPSRSRNTSGWAIVRSRPADWPAASGPTSTTAP